MMFELAAEVRHWGLLWSVRDEDTTNGKGGEGTTCSKGLEMTGDALRYACCGVKTAAANQEK